MNKSNYLTDFRVFLFLVWQHLRIPPPSGQSGDFAVPTPVQYDLANYLQHGPRRRIIEAFRGVGKSWITVSFVLWKLLRNPQLNVEVVSASKNLANNFSTFCFQLINSMELLQHLQPRADQRTSKIEFDVGPAKESKDPSVKSVGIFGQITGTRADLLIADDVETPNTAQTQSARDKLGETVKEFDAILKPNGDIIYLGTPQTEMSLYNGLPARGYGRRIWPARFPDEKALKNYGDDLAPMILNKWAPDLVGKSTDPQRFNEFDLAEREASYGRSGFNLQFMLDTALSDSDKFPLKISDLVVMDIDNEVAPEKVVWGSAPAQAWDDTIPNVGFNGERYYRPIEVSKPFIPYTGSVMAIDPSGRGGDETGYAVTKMLNGYLFVPKAGGLRGGYSEETLVKLKMIAHEQQVNRIIIESNFGDGMYAQLLKPILLREVKDPITGKIIEPSYPVTIEEVNHSKQKELRIIDTLEPVMNRHRLVVDPKVIREDYESAQCYPADKRDKYQLMWQLSRITKDRGAIPHDDRLDALAIAAAYWVEQMAQDEEKQIDRRKEEERDKQLQEFLDHCVGKDSSNNTMTWF